MTTDPNGIMGEQDQVRPQLEGHTVRPCKLPIMLAVMIWSVQAMIVVNAMIYRAKMFRTFATLLPTEPTVLVSTVNTVKPTSSALYPHLFA